MIFALKLGNSSTQVYFYLCTVASQTAIICDSLKTKLLQYIVGTSMKRTFGQALRRKELGEC